MAGNAVIGALRVVLGADTAQFDDALGGLRGKLGGVEKSMAAFGKRLQKVGAGLSLGLTAPLAAFGATSLKAFQGQENAVAALEAALKSMGPAAGFTSAQLQEMASGLQAVSTFGDEDILSKVTANLLTFGNVSGDVFTRAQGLALDLSARLGQDLQTSAIMLGKALNDPAQGLTALTRVGVAFTEQQKEQLKAMAEAGDIAGAQAIMLAELERQYGGQAAAMAGTTAGAMTQLNNAWGDFQEQVGAIVAEILPPLVTMLKDVVAWLQATDRDTLKWGVVLGGLAAAIGPVLAAIGLLVAGIAAIGLPIAAVIAGVAALSAGWIAFGDDISRIAEATYTAVKTWLLDKLEAVWSALQARIDAVTGFFSGMYQAVVGGSYVPDMVSEIGDWFGRLDAEMVAPAEAAASQVAGAFEQMGQRIGSILADGVFNGGDIGAGLKDLARGTLTDLARSAIGGGGGFGGAFGKGLVPSLLGGGFAGMFAAGGFIPPGQWGIAGEAGPEPVFGGRSGATVMPSNGGGPSVTINADFRGADPAAVPAIAGRLGQLERNLPRLIDSHLRSQRVNKGRLA